ncbi:MAG: hypothetical protein M1376_06745, partial [Planctomycetes bacterium]|nr:hypothetical protein [Planctomycetota bacterium]
RAEEPMNILGEEWFVRNYWILGAGMPGAGWSGWANAANTFPAGRILSFNDDRVFGYGREKVVAGPTGHREDVHRFFGTERKATPPSNGKKKAAGGPTPIWTTTQSLIVRAMVLGADRLAVAGPVDLAQKDPNLLAFKNEAEALASFEGHRGVYLRIVRATDGRKISESTLPTMPVFDGLAAARGRLYVALRNGTVECWGQ